MTQQPLFDGGGDSELEALRAEVRELRAELKRARRPKGGVAHAAAAHATRCGGVIGLHGVREALAPGAALSILTDGQASALDFVRVLVERVGPGARVVMSTWTAGVKDVEGLELLTRRGAIGELVFLVDRSFLSFARPQADAIVAAFGPAALRMVSTHAKVYVVEAADGSECWALRGSTNLNRNPRLENLDLTEGDVARWWRDTLLSIAQAAPEGPREAGEVDHDGAPMVRRVEALAAPPAAEGFKPRVLERMRELREAAAARGEPPPALGKLPGLARALRLSIPELRARLTRGADDETRRRIASLLALR